MSRPELTGHASLYYNQKEARKYDSSSRMISIQREITLRAIELLRLPKDGSSQLILDVGCGSGLSGQVLEQSGHVWVGCDVSRDMLQVAKERMDDALEYQPKSSNTKREFKDSEMGGREDNDSHVGNEDDDDDDDDDGDDESTGDDNPVTPKGDLLHHVRLRQQIRK